MCTHLQDKLNFVTTGPY